MERGSNRAKTLLIEKNTSSKVSYKRSASSKTNKLLESRPDHQPFSILGAFIKRKQNISLSSAFFRLRLDNPKSCQKNASVCSLISILNTKIQAQKSFPFQNLLRYSIQQTSKRTKIYQLSTVLYRQQAQLEKKRNFFAKIFEKYQGQVSESRNQRTSFMNNSFVMDDEFEAEEDSLNKIQEDSLERIPNHMPVSRKMPEKRKVGFATGKDQERLRRGSSQNQNDNDGQIDLSKCSVEKQIQRERDAINSQLKQSDYNTAKMTIDSFLIKFQRQNMAKIDTTLFQNIKTLIIKYKDAVDDTSSSIQHSTQINILQSNNLCLQALLDQQKENQSLCESKIKELNASLSEAYSRISLSLTQSFREQEGQSLISENDQLKQELIVQKRKIFEIRKRLQNQIRVSEEKTAKIRILRYALEREKARRLSPNRRNTSPILIEDDECSSPSLSISSSQVQQLKTQVQALKKQNSLVREKNKRMKQRTMDGNLLQKLNVKLVKSEKEVDQDYQSPTKLICQSSVCETNQIRLEHQKETVLKHLSEKEYSEATSAITVLIQQAHWENSPSEDIKIYQQLSKLIAELQMTKINLYRESGAHQRSPSPSSRKPIDTEEQSETEETNIKINKQNLALKQHLKLLEQEQDLSEQRILDLQAELVSTYGSLEKMEDVVNKMEKNKMILEQRYQNDVEELQTQIVKMAKQVNQLTEKNINQGFDSKEVIKSLTNSDESVQACEHQEVKKISDASNVTEQLSEPLGESKTRAQQELQNIKIKLSIILDELRGEKEYILGKIEGRSDGESERNLLSKEESFGKYINAESSNCQSAEETQESLCDVIRVQIALLVDKQKSRLKEELISEKKRNFEKTSALDLKITEKEAEIEKLCSSLSEEKQRYAESNDKVVVITQHFQALIDNMENDRQKQKQERAQIVAQLQKEKADLQSSRERLISLEDENQIRVLQLRGLESDFKESQKTWKKDEQQLKEINQQNLWKITEQQGQMDMQYYKENEKLKEDIGKMEIGYLQELMTSELKYQTKYTQKVQQIEQEKKNQREKAIVCVQESYILHEKLRKMEEDHYEKTQESNKVFKLIISEKNSRIDHLSLELQTQPKESDEIQSKSSSIIFLQKIQSLVEDKENKGSFLDQVVENVGLPNDSLTMLLHKEINSKRHENLYLRATIHKQDQEIIQIQSQLGATQNKVFVGELNLQESERKKFKLELQNKYLKDSESRFNSRMKVRSDEYEKQLEKIRDEVSEVSQKLFRTSNQKKYSSSTQDSSSEVALLREEIERLKSENEICRQTIFSLNEVRSVGSSQIITPITNSKDSLDQMNSNNKEILEYLNQEIHKLAQANTRLQLKVVILEGKTQISEHFKDTMRFFDLLYHVLGNLIRFMEEHAFVIDQNHYAEFLTASHESIQNGEFDDLFGELEKFLKVLFIEQESKTQQQIYKAVNVQENASIKKPIEKETNGNNQQLEKHLQNCRMTLYQVKYLLKEFQGTNEAKYLEMVYQVICAAHI